MRNLAKFLIPLLLIPQVCFGEASRSFDGTNDNLVRNSISSIDTDVMSISAWVYVTSFLNNGTGTNCLLTASANSAGNSAAAFNIGRSATRTNGMSFEYRFSTTIGYWETPTNSLTANAWNNITVTYDRSSTANDPTIWINGESVSVTEVATPVGTKKSSVATIKFGENVAGTNDFAGQVSNAIFVFGYAFTDADVKNIVRNPELFSSAERKAFYPLWGDSGEIDLSGNGNSLTVTGATTSNSGPPVMFGGGLPL